MNIYSKISILLLALCIGRNIPLKSQPIQITTSDSVIRSVNKNFNGIQYHRNTYDNSVFLQKISAIPIKYIRVWAKPEQIRPDSTTWNWDEMDQKISEIVNGGFEPIICIYQGEDWYLGTPENPWWNDEANMDEWYQLVDSTAQKYGQHSDYMILFDELNYLNPSHPYYISFSESAELFINSASLIKEAHPSIKVGGPSGFNGWENGHWANYVFNQTEEDSLLGFISSNIFLSWDKDDTNREIMDKTIWYEEAPLKIRSMTTSDYQPELILDAYNASALWTIDGTKDGELWTDPRNVNFFGGVYQALAQLHALKGGFDIALRWETIGGYGIFDWYPQFNKLPTFYSWELLTQLLELDNSLSLLKVETTEQPQENLHHHSGMDVKGYSVQPFYVKSSSGNTSLILINKYDSVKHVEINIPDGKQSFKTYQFHQSRVENALVPVDSSESQNYSLMIPPVSITVIKYSEEELSVSNDFLEKNISFELNKNYPNPFNTSTNISFTLNESGLVRLEVFDINGRKIKEVINKRYTEGSHIVNFEAGNLASGVYFYTITFKGLTKTDRLTLIK